MTRPVNIDHLSTKIAVFSCILYLNLIATYLYYCNKIFITTAEFNRLSSAAYGNGILHYEWKIFVKIWLNVVCAHMVEGLVTYCGTLVINVVCYCCRFSSATSKWVQAVNCAACKAMIKRGHKMVKCKCELKHNIHKCDLT